MACNASVDRLQAMDALTESHGHSRRRLADQAHVEMCATPARPHKPMKRSLLLDTARWHRHRKVRYRMAHNWAIADERARHEIPIWDRFGACRYLYWAAMQPAGLPCRHCDALCIRSCAEHAAHALA